MATSRKRRSKKLLPAGPGAYLYPQKTAPKPKPKRARKPKPSRARKRAPPRPAHWYQEYGREASERDARARVAQSRLAPENVEAYVAGERRVKQQQVKETLADQVKNLRKYFRGFEASDGYDLNRITRWHGQRVNQVRMYSDYLRNLQSVKGIRVDPGVDPGFRKAVQTRTGQYSPRQYAYVYHAEKPETTTIEFREGQLMEVRKVRGMKLITQYWFFQEILGYQPYTFGEMWNATKKMLPRMPDGYYVLHTAPHGPIGRSVHKRDIHLLLQRYEYEYEDPNTIEQHEGFAEAVLGYEWLGTEDEDKADAYDRKLDLERAARRSAATRQARLKRRRSVFQRRMGRAR